MRQPGPTTRSHKAVTADNGKWGGAALCGAVLIAVSGCGASGTQVRPVTDKGRYAVSVIDVERGEHHSFGVAALCVERGDEAEITAVTTPPGAGLEIAAYSVGADPTSIGALAGTLEDLGVDTTNHVLEQPCPADGDTGAHQGTALLVEAVAPGDRSARSDHLTVHWEAGGKTGEFDVPWAITLCTVVDQEVSEVCRERRGDTRSSRDAGTDG